MFGNFLYFIVALLITSTYHPTEEPGLGTAETLALFLLLCGAYAVYALLCFRRIDAAARHAPEAVADQQFQSAILRCSILAVGVHALAIYGLSLPALVERLPLVGGSSTLQSLLFLALFTGYLALAWSAAFPAYRRIYRPEFGRGEYVWSNISFALPVLLPWLLLSGTLDLLNVFAPGPVRRVLETTEGQIGVFSVFLLGTAIVAPGFIKRFWRCRPLAAGPARARIEALCRRAGLAFADILHWPLFGGRMITAGVMGLARRFRYILVTPSLLEVLEPEELDAVMAHEIGHVKRRHLLFYLLFFAGYLLLSLVVYDLFLYGMLYAEPLWEAFRRSGISQATLVSIVFSAAILGVFLIYFRFVFGFFMRNFERQADGYVFRLLPSARPLVTTLQKIAAASRQSPDRPNWHHFSIRQRIEFLLACEADPRRLARHDRRVRRAIGLYLAVLALLAVVGYQVNLGTVGARMSDHLFATLLEREIAKNPHSAALYGLLGDLQYRRRNWDEARLAWEASLLRKPDNPVVLNNLAWLLATCEDERLRDPPRALELALEAARLQESSFILDTLAESYFANGRYEEALVTGERALRLAAGDRRHYEEQLRKFREKARGGA